MSVRASAAALRAVSRALPAVLLPLAVLTASPAVVGGAQLLAQGQDEDEGPPPQTFDWWQERGVPATTPWGQPVDVASTEQILSWTTMPEYTTPLVDHLPDHPTVVSPTEHFGHPIGRPGVLHKVDEIYGYLDALAASSPRVHFDRLGETEEGRHLALIKVGSEENLARLDEIRAGLQALADPRSTTEEEAEALIAELPAIYTFYAGLHSTETGPPEMVMEMAYRLAASDDPLIRDIRDEVVVFIVPVAEPDGRDRVVDWHRRYNSEPGEDRVPGPPYWGKYVFHDNNRDGLQQSVRLTQELTQLFLDWRYPVGHDLHESVPYLYVSTGTGPYNPTIDPITVSEWQWMSNYEVAQMTSMGAPGVWTHDFYTGWYPGYLLWVTNTRNAVGRFYETFGNSVPHTMERTVGGQSSVEWFRPNPPREETLWSLRNNTNYMQTGALTALELVAENRPEILRNFWRKSKNSLNEGRTEAPYAYVVPADQLRRPDVAYMLNLLRRQGIEVHRATEGGAFAGGPSWIEDRSDTVTVEEGDYVVRMDQPFRNFALTLMQRQDFPEDAPSPYDDVAWTYPLMFNVDAFAVDEREVQDLAMEAVGDEVRIAGRALGRRGDVWLVQPHASAHVLPARLALGADATVHVAEDSVDVGEAILAPGAWVLREAELPDVDVAQWATDHGFVAHRVRASALEDVTTHLMDLPRVALLHTWSRTQDEGWTRMALDRTGYPYDYVGEDRIGGMGDLRDRYDVILFPHQGGADARRIFHGIDPEDGPIAFTRTPEFPSHGTPDSTEDMTGGMGFEGLSALAEFVQGGGTLVAVGSAGNLPVEMGIVREVDTRERGSAVVPGSILRGEVVDPANPLAYGYGETVPLYHQFGPYFDADGDAEDGVAVRYAEEDMLMSGVARSAGSLGGQPAVLAAPVGEGWVVLTGFDATHRYQNHGNFGFVWNALLNWNDLGAALEDEDEAVAEPQEAGQAAGGAAMPAGPAHGWH